MTLISRFLDTNGDGSGTKNANGDYSGTGLGEEIFWFDPESQYVDIARMIVTLEDTSGFQAQEYGNLGGALTNGIQARIQDDTGTIVDLTDSETIKTNAGWTAFCYDADVKTWGAGNELLTVRWTFSKSGQFIKLHGDQRFEIVLNDDFSGLIGHYFLVQGHTG